VLDKPLMHGKRFIDGEKTIAVTITDRDDFWDREMPMLQRLAERFPKSRRVLVLHNDYAMPFVTTSRIEHLRLPRKLVGNVLGARTLARNLGYEVYMPKTADEALAFYRNSVDMHFGSRLHAHLLMLSWNKKSFLVSVDERMAGFSEYLGFPLCDGAKIDSYLDFDFEIVRNQAQKADVVMQKFVSTLAALT
jgi:polysaccharide pyruvyl transferase WcaK-like protein